MPGLDGTGPLGQGPMTGGGFGRCNPSADPAVYGGRGMGMGRGRMNRRFVRRNLNMREYAAEPAEQTVDAGAGAFEARALELEKTIEELRAQNDELLKANEKLRAKKNK